MFKKILCKHEYKLYDQNIITYYFICRKCKKEMKMDKDQILKDYFNLKKEYKKRLAIGENPLEDSKIETLQIESPAVTLLIDKYAHKGINLKQLDYDLVF